MAIALTLEHVSKAFHDTPGQAFPVVRDVTLTIAAGEIFTLLGPSGSGKSTLLRIMSGLEHDYEGAVTFGPGFTKHDVGFVFQQFALLPWLSVSENIALGLRARGVAPGDRSTIVRREVDRFGLHKFAGASIRELSGGMRQRVGIARALAINPKIIFMDEPFSELDSFTAEDLRQELLTIWQQTGLTIVLVTHMIPEAIELADHIAVLTPRPARIEKIVSNTLPRPRQMRTEPFYHLEDELNQLVRP